LRGWVFKASLAFGAMSIGAKVHQILVFSDISKTEQRFRKQLYYLVLGVKYESFQHIDPKSLPSDSCEIDVSQFAGQNGLSAGACKQESRLKVICRAIFGECWCWFTPEEKRNRFLSDTKDEDSPTERVQGDEDSPTECVQGDLKCHIGNSGTKQVEMKELKVSTISNLNGESSGSHAHAAALRSPAGLSPTEGSRVRKSIPCIIPKFLRTLSRYNVQESSQHNVLVEEVEASPPIEANVCRRCGAVTEKKLCQTVMNNRLGLVLLPENQKRGEYSPRSVYTPRSIHSSLRDKNSSATSPLTSINYD